jgi:hypothetical protein
MVDCGRAGGARSEYEGGPPEALGPSAEQREGRHTDDDPGPDLIRGADRVTPGLSSARIRARDSAERRSMKFDWRYNRDFFAGLLYIVTGTVAIIIARDYPFGSALRMGPGYFPTVLGGIMIAFGVAVMMMGVKNNEKIKPHWSFRALIVLPISTVVFGVMMEEAGFIPALLVLVPFAASAGREFKIVEVALLMIGLTILSTALFIYGLGLPYPLIKGLWGY